MQKKKKKNLDAGFVPFTKINSKWLTDLSVKCKTIKFVDHIEKNLDDPGFSDDFLDTTLNAWSMKETANKLDFIEIKNFCSVKDTVKGMRRQATHWEKIFA